LLRGTPGVSAPLGLGLRHYLGMCDQDERSTLLKKAGINTSQ
jgi:hypothetical protein